MSSNKMIMMRFMIAIFAAMLALCGCAAGFPEAIAKLTLKVRNQDGEVVTNAYVSIGFYCGSKEKGYKFDHAEGLPDAEGCFSAQGLCSVDAWCGVGKFRLDEHYYNTSFSHYFNKNGKIENGRWTPWNPIVPVIVKEKKKPIPMYVKEAFGATKMPGLGKTGTFKAGYDLKEFDWIVPLGYGKTADVILTVIKERISGCLFKHTIKMEFPKEGDGLYRKKKDMFSEFVSDYYANTNAVFQSSMCFVYDSLSGKVTEDTSLKEDEYLVLRTRSIVDDAGNLVSAHYSKIYGEMSVIPDGLRWATYFNPTPNDTNLECDPKKSFYPGRYRPSCP